MMSYYFHVYTHAGNRCDLSHIYTECIFDSLLFANMYGVYRIDRYHGESYSLFVSKGSHRGDVERNGECQFCSENS